MAKKLSVLVVVAGTLLAGAAAAQDARTVLRAASQAMGDASRLESIQYSGTGWMAAVGQSYSPDDDWPRFEITAYTRTIDYDVPSSREELTRRQGNNPPRGGGGTPLQGDQRQVLLTSGRYAWNMNADVAAPQPAAAEVRQIDIWMSPHGFLKAGLEADDATAVSLNLEGRDLTIVSFTAMDKFRVNGTINEDNRVERVQTWIANPVLGDTIYDHRFTEYRDFGGVMFPTVLHTHQGDPAINAGHNLMEIRVTSAQPNVDAPALAVPDNVRQATVPPVAVESTQLANGVWRIAGGTHHSVAVEFRDYVAVVEAPQSEARSVAVIAEVKRLIPNKPIRYVVNTHHHFDHSGGLRTYVAQSATVVTHQGNRDFYQHVVFHPGTRTMEPDILSSRMPWFGGNRVPTFETVGTKYVISDGVRTLDLYAMQGLDHAAGMLIAYLPTERILINADLYSPPAPGAQAPAANASMRSLAANIRRLNLNVDRHVGIHGQVASHQDFLGIVGNQ
jgi:glyoxylase-like metal-dependent hydrolase (beta-lactamase superfamily II)